MWAEGEGRECGRMLEVTVERRLARLCQDCGGMCVKLSAEHARGIPDRLMILPNGQVCFVELKRPQGGRIALAQRVWHERLRRLGQRVEVVSTVEQAQELIEQLSGE